METSWAIKVTKSSKPQSNWAWPTKNIGPCGPRRISGLGPTGPSWVPFQIKKSRDFFYNSYCPYYWALLIQAVPHTNSGPWGFLKILLQLLPVLLTFWTLTKLYHKPKQGPVLWPSQTKHTSLTTSTHFSYSYQAVPHTNSGPCHGPSQIPFTTLSYPTDLTYTGKLYTTHNSSYWVPPKSSYNFYHSNRLLYYYQAVPHICKALAPHQTCLTSLTTPTDL